MDSTDTKVISVSGLRKSYGDKAVVQDLDLTVTRGAVHGLVGLNGSGKTTTLECMLGLQQFNAGDIRLLGASPDKLYRLQGRVVAVFDSPSLNPNLTVAQCLRQAQLLCPEQRRSIAEVEKLLGIERFHHYKIKQLSLGNKRRASIAQALLGNPELIILDEPFNGLDAGGVDEVLALISQLNEQANTSFLLSSHQLPYLEQVCSHIAILHEGAIKRSAAIEDLLAGSNNRVKLLSPDAEAAIEFIRNQQTGVEFKHQDEAGYLHLELTAMESAELNASLIRQGLDISELILERASLDSLFRQLTREAS
jgi:ABC-2 type transport system ATP-binding protein